MDETTILPLTVHIEACGGKLGVRADEITLPRLIECLAKKGLTAHGRIHRTACTLVGMTNDPARPHLVIGDRLVVDDEAAAEVDGEGITVHTFTVGSLERDNVIFWRKTQINKDGTPNDEGLEKVQSRAQLNFYLLKLYKNGELVFDLNERDEEDRPIHH